MKVVTAPFTAMRLNTTIPGTKTRITISQYDEAWVWESDTDITDRVLKGQPNIDNEIEDAVAEFRTDALVLSLEDEDDAIRDLIYTANKYFLILVEKGFDGIADWLTIFDGIIEPLETIDYARNIDTITAYSMETELEYHPAAGVGAITLIQKVNDLWDDSYIPITNRTISVPGPYSWGGIASSYAGWNVREALDNLALVNGCIWKRTERDTAVFLHRNYYVAANTFNLDTNLYGTKFEYRTRRGLDGVHTENTALAIEAYSTGYVDGFNQYINNQLYINACKQCHWSAEENWSFQRYNKRIFKIPAFYLLELEPLDRVNLTLRDKEGNLEETVHTQFTGSEYDDTNKITRIKLEERLPRVYEKYTCGDDGRVDIEGTNWVAQTYTIGVDGYDQAHDIVHVRLEMLRVGNPGNLIISIKNTVAGVPAGADIATVTVNANVFMGVAPALWYQFDFVASAAQALATQYAIVARVPGGSPGNEVRWRLDSTAATYTGGQAFTSPNSGTNWFPNATEDFMFGCWGEIT